LRISENFGEFRRILQYGEYQRISENFGEYRRILENFGEYRRLSENILQQVFMVF
jgi:hypothetical protein